MHTKTVAVILFYDEKGRVLLQDRRNFPPGRAPWGMFGGGIEKGETPEQTLVREIQEELCYKIDSYEFLGTFEGDHAAHTVVAHAFIASLPANWSEKFIVMEGQGMKLCTVAAARELLVRGEQPKILDAFEEWFS